MIRLSTLLAVTILSLSAFTLYAAPTSRVIQEDDIREAAFRFQLHPYPLPSRAKPKKKVKEPAPIQAPKDYVDPFKVYFLSVENDKDPSDKLLKRFAGHKPPIKRVSQSYIDSKSTDPKTSGLWVRDKQTKDIGLIYRVTSIRWLSRNKVTAKGGYFGGGLFATSNTYTLTRRGKTWKVTHIKYGPVS